MPLALPASIYGIIALFLCLAAGVVRMESIREISTLLIEIMPVLFIAPAAGLIDIWPAIRGDWPAYLFITVITTFIVMIVSGHATQWVLRGENHGKGER